MVVRPANMMDGNQNNDDNDDTDEMIRIVKFMDRYPTMKRLFIVLEHKMNNNNNNNNNTDDSNNSNDSDSEDSADDVDDDADNDVDNDDDNRYLWLLQNEIDDTVNEFVGKMNTVVTEYEERFLPIFCGGNEEQRDNLPIPAGMRICRDNFIDVIDDSFDFSLGKSTMTVSKCLHHMDRKACTLLDKTWSHEVINVEDNRDFARGLDIAYDTEEEVQNMLRIFPDSINWWYDNNFNCGLVLEPKSVTLLPVMLEACIDHGKDIDVLKSMLVSHDEDDMGVITRRCIIQRLNMTHSDIEDKRLYDARCLTVLRRLKEMQLLRKEDVQEYRLLHKLCDKSLILNSHNFFARQRFDFLVQLDPYGLINQPKSEGGFVGDLLLRACTSSFSSIEDFEIVFEAMVRYFPKMKGICTLFQANIHTGIKRSSPFKAACDVNNLRQRMNKNRYRRDDVMDVIEKVLVRNSALILHTDEQTQTCNDPLILAMIDDQITLDGLFFLLRRSPDVLPNILLQQNSNESSYSPRNHELINAASSSSAASNKIRPKKKRRT